jgi:hypothetical protein
MKVLLVLCTLCIGSLSYIGTRASAQWKPGELQHEPTRLVLPGMWRAVFPDSLVEVPERSVTVNVQQSSGRHIAFGALAGALAGAMLFYTTGYPCSGDVMFCELGFVSYGAIGAVAGGFAGYIISGARSRLSSLDSLVAVNKVGGPRVANPHAAKELSNRPDGCTVGARRSSDAAGEGRAHWSPTEVSLARDLERHLLHREEWMYLACAPARPPAL